MVDHPSRRRFPWSGRRFRLIGLLSTALLLASCSVMEIQDAPLSAVNPKGPFAERIDNLFWPVFWVATAIFVVVQGALLVAIFVFRDRKGRKEPKQVHGNAKLEVTWTVIPTLILASIAVPTVQAVFDLTECGSDAMEVDIIAHQWWFEFQYPDYDIETANVLVIPAGREVCAHMTSDDVIHNFWVPELNGKRYLIPGQETVLRLEAYDPGEYWGHCAEFCGLSHSLMRARVQAKTQADFEQWVAGQQLEAPIPQEGTLAWDGLQTYLSKGCTQCHTVDFVDNETVQDNIVAPENFNGPNLTHFASRNVFAGASLPYTGDTPDESVTYEQALQMWLADPPTVKPGSYMPNLGLTQQEINALIAWLETLK